MSNEEKIKKLWSELCYLSCVGSRSDFIAKRKEWCEWRKITQHD